MDEEMETEMTKMELTPDHLAHSEYEGADEAIPIHIRKERMTKSYKKTMSQDIKTIDTYETRTKCNITQWGPIYEVVDEAYIKESNISPDDFIIECKNNSNKPRFISSDVKNDIKRIATEQILCAQVVKLWRKDLQFVATDKNKSEAKFKFQGQSAR